MLFSITQELRRLFESIHLANQVDAYDFFLQAAVSLPKVWADDF
jgi:hypothetical protein